MLWSDWPDPGRESPDSPHRETRRDLREAQTMLRRLGLVVACAAVLALLAVW
jgi:hypothetical protein